MNSTYGNTTTTTTTTLPSPELSPRMRRELQNLGRGTAAGGGAINNTSSLSPRFAPSPPRIDQRTAAVSRLSPMSSPSLFQTLPAERQLSFSPRMESSPKKSKTLLYTVGGVVIFIVVCGISWFLWNHWHKNNKSSSKETGLTGTENLALSSPSSSAASDAKLANCINNTTFTAAGGGGGEEAVAINSGGGRAATTTMRRRLVVRATRGGPSAATRNLMRRQDMTPPQAAAVAAGRSKEELEARHSQGKLYESAANNSDKDLVHPSQRDRLITAADRADYTDPETGHFCPKPVLRHRQAMEARILQDTFDKNRSADRQKELQYSVFKEEMQSRN